MLYILFSPLVYTSDSLYYYQLAENCLANHNFYPSPSNFYNDYLVAPLYINLLVVLLSIANAKIIIGLLNIILNFIQLGLIYKISEKLFGKETAKTSAIIYIFYLSTLGMILFNYTELLFLTLIIASVYFYLKNSNMMLLFSGIFAAAAIGVRPLGWALVGAYLFNYLYDYKNIKPNFSKLLFLLTGTALFIFAFGLFTYSFSGRFIYSSVNGPVNILIGANDNATGAYNDKVFQEGKIGFINNPGSLTYDQKQSIWLKESLSWIKAHPIKWVSLFPMKIIHMFIWDDFSVSRLMNLTDWNLYRVAKNIFSNDKEKLLGDRPAFIKFSYFLLLIVHHVYYFSILVLLILVLFKFFNEIIKNEILRILILFSILGISIHLLTFGDARYKYPYIMVAIILITPFVNNLIIHGKFKFIIGESGKNYV